MSQRHKSGSSTRRGPPKPALLWIGIGTVVVLGGLFALSRGGIREAPPPTDALAQREVDPVLDDLLMEEETDEEFTFKKRKRKRSSRRPKVSERAAPPAVAPATVAPVKGKPSKKAGRSKPNADFKLTEAELIGLSREVAGSNEPVITMPKESGAPSGTSATPPQTGLSYSVGPERLFTLLVLGSLGGQTLGREDAQTWARMGYFLQVQAPRRFFLVQPSGDIKVILPKGFKGDFPATPTANGTPDFRLVLRASARQGQNLRFYGKKLAGSYRCTIQCTIEQHNGEEYKVVGGERVTEEFTPTRKIDQATILRTAYDMALQKLANKLGRNGFFRPRT